MPDDPSTPPPPEAPRFDLARNAWVLSRHADVTAALRDPNLWPVGGGKREIQTDSRDETGRLKLRAEMLDSLQRLDEWRPQLEPVTHAALHRLATNRPVDLLSEFTLPWGLELAILVTHADPAERQRLSDLGTRVFAATGAADTDTQLRADAAAATAELERIFTAGPIPMGEPAFVALSQTLPRLLANCWLALLRHPDEFARLRAHPELLPNAVEELLRYGGIVRRVFRRATADIDLGGVRIGNGDLAVLMLASANRDPDQFPDPNRLDLARPIATHVSLGTGRNSCVGAMLIRMAASVATAALTTRFSSATPLDVPDWRLGSGFCFPASVNVTLHPS